MYTVLLHITYRIGLHKTAVRIANRWYVCTEHWRRNNAAWDLFIWIHRRDQNELNCSQAEWEQFVLEEEARMEQQRHEDDEYCQLVTDIEDAMGSIDDDGFDDDSPDDDICEGICGQPAYACTCAETEAFRRHNADPATRGSWFVA